MKKIILAVFFIGLSTAYCTEWFTVPMDKFNSIDYSTSTLTVQVTDGTIPQILGSSSGYVGVNQLNITPPSGKEQAWLAMAMSAAATKAQLMVLGTKSGNVVTVTSSDKLAVQF